MILPLSGLVVVWLAGFCLADGPPSISFLGVGTDKITTSLLQNDAENRTNLVFSPLGYSVILAILAEGSRGGTRNQLTNFLNYPEDTYAARTTYKAVLSLMQERNAVNQPEFKNWFYIYKNCTVEDSYRNVIEDNFLTQIKEIERDEYEFSHSSGEVQEESQATEHNKPLEEVDLKGEGTTMVNDIGESTARSNMENVEEEIMSAISANRLSSTEDNSTTPESRMIIFNALYYQGRWANKFSAVEGGFDFEPADGAKKSVASIQTVGEFEYGRLRQLRAAAINIPYEGGRYSLLLILPDRGDSLVSIIKRLPKVTLSQIEGQLSKRQVKVTLPKFKFYTITRPKAALQKEGVEDIFNGNADLSGMTGHKGLFLDDLVQLVTIVVNQESSSYNFLTTSSVANVRQSVAEFTAQRPFLYFLRDRIDNYVVIAGKVEDPSEES